LTGFNGKLHNGVPSKKRDNLRRCTKRLK
jgi:hypothetical protein